jgi:hypothetical protein
MSGSQKTNPVPSWWDVFTEEASQPDALDILGALSSGVEEQYKAIGELTY